MRLRACLGSLLLLCGACAELPKTLRVEVDGHSVEVERKKEPADDERRR